MNVVGYKDRDVLAADVIAAKSGDRRAADRIVRAFEPLVVKVLADYCVEDEDREDAAQEGRLGIWNAVITCRDPLAFQAHARQKVRDAVRRYAAKERLHREREVPVGSTLDLERLMNPGDDS